MFTIHYVCVFSLYQSVNGYFVHFIAPNISEPLPKDVLFILDTSTSMMWQKLEQLQDAMRVILQVRLQEY